MDREEFRPSEARFVAEAKVLCNAQLHAQGRVDSRQLLYYNKRCSFNTPFRMFSENSSVFCFVLSSLSVVRGEN